MLGLVHPVQGVRIEACAMPFSGVVGYRFLFCHLVVTPPTLHRGDSGLTAQVVMVILKWLAALHLICAVLDRYLTLR